MYITTAIIRACTECKTPVTNEQVMFALNNKLRKELNKMMS